MDSTVSLTYGIHSISNKKYKPSVKMFKAVITIMFTPRQVIPSWSIATPSATKNIHKNHY